MTHRERVLKTLNHKEADRIPLDLGGNVSGMMGETYLNLKKYLNLDECGYDVIDNEWFLTFIFDERILKLFDIDFRRVFLRGPAGYTKKIREDGTWIDLMGFIRKKSGYYGEIISHPLRKTDDIDDIKKFKFFNAGDKAMISGLKEEAINLYNNTDYAISARQAVGGLLETCTWARGFDQFPIDLIFNKKLAHVLLDKITDLYMELMGLFLGEVGDYIHVVEMADDLGTQTGLFLSPDLYKEMIFPYYKKLLDLIKSKTTAKILHHSCGSVLGIVQNLIDAGVDILNPLQPRAKDMDTTFLKDKYGDKLCFHGGIDIQYVMPHGTKKDIEDEVKRRIAIYAPGGGYILSCAHDIQPDTPPQNIVCMYEFAKEYGKYPLDKNIKKIRGNIKNKKK